jgi:hypothetical protein
MKDILAIAIAMMAFAPLPGQAAPTISGKYYDESATASCVGASGCTLNFTATPSDQFLDLEQVSCAANIGSSVSYAMIFINVKNTSRYFYLPTLPSHVVSNEHLIDFAQPVKFRIGFGRVPTLTINASAVTNVLMFCTIVGTLSTQ